jgi:hypothetical protein
LVPRGARYETYLQGFPAFGTCPTGCDTHRNK